MANADVSAPRCDFVVSLLKADDKFTARRAWVCSYAGLADLDEYCFDVGRTHG